MLHIEEGQIKMGKFTQGELDGHSRIIFDNGLIMDGLFKDSKFHGNVILHDFSNTEWRESYFEDSQMKKEISKGYGFPRNLLLKYRQSYYGNVMPKWDDHMKLDIIDNSISREKLFYILYGMDVESSNNDLDFGWDDQNENLYKSDGSEPQLSFGGDRKAFGYSDADNSDNLMGGGGLMGSGGPEKKKSVQSEPHDDNSNDGKPGFFHSGGGECGTGNNLSKSFLNHLPKIYKENSEAFTLGEVSKDNDQEKSEVKNLVSFPQYNISEQLIQ
jgi:hypothetical protein